MSTKPLLGAPFEPGVIQQLQVRSNKRKSNNLTDRDLTVKVKNFDLDTNYFAKREDGEKFEKKEKTFN